MPETAAAPMSIVYLVSTFGGVAWYRCHVPGMELRRRGHNVLMTDQLAEVDLSDCDVLVVLRQHRPEVLELVRAQNARGGMTVFEIDDDYWNLAPDNPATITWTPEKLSGLAAMARECRIVTTSTSELAEKTRTLNPSTRVLRNMLPDEHWPTSRRTEDPATPLVLGWAGGASHAADVRIVAPVFLQLLDDFPDLEVHLAGAGEDWVPAHPRLRHLEPVMIEEYPDLLSGFDIAVAPLVDTRFNRCKSDLKFIEYAMVGIPVVASATDSYTSTVRQGENGFLAKNTKDWLKYLRRLIADAELRDRIGAAARETAERRLISQNIAKWERTYDAS